MDSANAPAYISFVGLQVFATLDEIPIFNSLTKSNVTGMVLNASWSRSTGFSLNVLLPVARNLAFGKGITTTPITLSLDMTPSPIDKAKLIPSLQVSSGLYIPIAHSTKPLLFQIILTALDTDATIAAELKGNWVDPFGISDEVVVGPDLFLQADFSYVTGLRYVNVYGFSGTQILRIWIPDSGVLFKGGLAVGNTNASVVVSVNEDPLKEVLYSEIDNLNFTDVVSFAEKLLHLKLPPPPSNFLEFEKVKFYVCPTGSIVQGVSYPPGFSLESDMILFGRHVDVSCDICLIGLGADVNSNFLSINGIVDNFEVGPLKVNKLNGAKQAVLQVQVGKDVQHLLLDGAITLYAETYALHLLVDTQPSPEISFKIEFKLTELLTFEVDATLIGALDFKDLRKADFSFNADLKQHLLDYIHDELLNLFEKAQQAAEEGIEAAKKQVATEQATLDNRIAQVKTRLKVAQATWEAYQKRVTQTNLKIIND
ncbi:hypothetical protein J3R83DRAFT_9618 [Lanmaoa asiatica]|nr:hypothetical protein J3R83DRAFT_9618 [Lanmaoa asiatica]